jgi:hypothetical protein
MQSGADPADVTPQPELWRASRDMVCTVLQFPLWQDVTTWLLCCRAASKRSGCGCTNGRKPCILSARKWWKMPTELGCSLLGSGRCGDQAKFQNHRGTLPSRNSS